MRLTSIDLWNLREQICLALLGDGLSTLANESLDAYEDDLNRKLFHAINRLTHMAMQSGIDAPPLIYEGRNPPSPSDLRRVKREYKRPDFYWVYNDPLAIDPDDSYKPFVVECKRLSSPRSRFSSEYMQSGIARFINVDHGYGKGMRSGAMVGYLQKVYIDDALDDVNALAMGAAIPILAIKYRNGETRALFDHRITRPFSVSPFLLTHVWARIGPSQSTSSTL